MIDPDKLKIGFSGTRRGMTTEQYAAFRELLVELAPAEFHHGDCVGADYQAADWANVCDSIKTIVKHPPIGNRLCGRNAFYDRSEQPAPYLVRNANIVDATDGLIVAPAEMSHRRHGGTWHTHDCAEAAGKPVWTVWPDGVWTCNAKAKAVVELMQKQEASDANE